MFLANFSEMADLSGKTCIFLNGQICNKKGGHSSRGRPFKLEITDIFKHSAIVIVQIKLALNINWKQRARWTKLDKTVEVTQKATGCYIILVRTSV